MHFQRKGITQRHAYRDQGIIEGHSLSATGTCGHLLEQMYIGKRKIPRHLDPDILKLLSDLTMIPRHLNHYHSPHVKIDLHRGQVISGFLTSV